MTWKHISLGSAPDGHGSAPAAGAAGAVVGAAVVVGEVVATVVVVRAVLRALLLAGLPLVLVVAVLFAPADGEMSMLTLLARSATATEPRKTRDPSLVTFIAVLVAAAASLRA